jgi:hypothetical protein
VKIVENSMIPTTRALNVEEGKIGDIGKTAGPLEILYDPADIFLKFLTFPSFATYKVTNHIQRLPEKCPFAVVDIVVNQAYIRGEYF